MVKDLTPYQGREQAYGLFHCESCSKEWTSTYSWTNTPQGCISCSIFVYPHHQWELKTNNKKKHKKHLQELCGKCRFQEKSCADN